MNLRLNRLISYVIPIVIFSVPAFSLAAVNCNNVKIDIEQAISKGKTSLLEAQLSNCISSESLTLNSARWLQLALEGRSQETFKALLHAGSDPSQHINFGENLIDWAIKQNNPWALKQVLDAGVNESISFHLDHIAIEPLKSGHMEIVELLIDAGIEPERAESLLAQSITVGDLKITQRIVEQYKISLSTSQNYSISAALSQTMNNQDIDMLRYLLSQGISLQWVSGIKPIFTNAFKQHDTELIKLLCQAGFEDIEAYFIRAIEEQTPARLKAITTHCITPSNHRMLYQRTIMSTLASQNEKLLKAYWAEEFDINAKVDWRSTALGLAVRQGDRWMVNYLVEHGADITIENDNTLLLITAIESKYPALALDLINLGAPLINQKGYQLRQPVDIAFKHGQLDVYDLLIKKGIQPALSLQNQCEAVKKSGDWILLMACAQKGLVDDVNNYLGPALLEATRQNDLALIKRLIELGAPIHIQHYRNESALSIACEKGYTPIVDYLVTLPHPAVLVDESYYALAIYKQNHLYERLRAAQLDPPQDLIHRAAAFRNLALIEQLIAENYDINKLDAKGNSPLLAFSASDHWSISGEDLYKDYLSLIELGSTTTLSNLEGENALSLRLNKYDENTQALSLISLDLLKQGSQVPATLSHNYIELLDRLIIARNADHTKQLLNAGVSAQTPEVSQQKLINRALSTNQPDLVALLIEHGAQVDGIDTASGLSSLHLAVKYSSAAIVEILLLSGAPIEQKAITPRGETALMLAIEKEDIKSVKILLQHGASVGSIDSQGNDAFDYLVANSPVELEPLLELHSNTNTPQLSLYVSKVQDLSAKPIAISPNGLLSVRNANNLLELWDERSQRALRLIDDSRNFYDKLILAEFFNDTTLLYAYRGDKQVTMVNLQDNAIIRSFGPVLDGYQAFKSGLKSAAYDRKHHQLALSNEYLTSVIDTADWRVTEKWGSVSLSGLAFTEQDQHLTGFDNHDYVRLPLANGKSEATNASPIIFDRFSKSQLTTVKHLAINRNGIAIISQGTDKKVKGEVIHIWDTKSNQPISILDTKKSPITHLAFHPDNQHFISLHEANGSVSDLVMWDLSSLTPVWQTQVATGYSTPAVYFSDQGHFFISTSKLDINVFSLKSAQPIRTFRVRDVSDIQQMLTIEGDQLLITDGKTIQLVDWRTGKQLVSQIGNNKYYHGFAYHAAQGLVTLAYQIDTEGNQNNIRVLTLDPITLALRDEHPLDKSGSSDADSRQAIASARCIFNLEFASDNDIVVSCWEKGVFRWSVSEDKFARIGKATGTRFGTSLDALTIAPQRSIALIATDDYSWQSYALPEFTLSNSHYYRLDNRLQVNVLAATESHLVTGSEKRQELMLWDKATQRLLGKFVSKDNQQQVTGVALAEQADRMISWDRSNNVQLWSLSSLEYIGTITPSNDAVDIISAAIDSSGSHIAIGLLDGSTEIWSTVNRSLVHRLPKQKLRVRDVKFSPSGDKLLVSSNKVTVWDVFTGEKLASQPTQSGWATQSDFFEYDTKVVTTYQLRADDFSSHYYSVWWDLETGDIIEQHDGLQLINQDQASSRFLFADNTQFKLWDPNNGLNPLPISHSEPAAAWLTSDSITIATENDVLSIDLDSQQARFYQHKVPNTDLDGNSELHQIYYSDNRDWALIRSDHKLSLFDVRNDTMLGCFDKKLGKIQQFYFDDQNQQFEITDRGLGTFSAQFKELSNTHTQCIPLKQGALAIAHDTRTKGNKFVNSANKQKHQDSTKASLSVVSNNKRKMAFAHNNVIRLLDLTTGAISDPIYTPVGIKGIALSDNGDQLASFHYDAQVRVFNTNLQTQTSQFDARYAQIENLVFEQHANTGVLTVVTTQNRDVEQVCNPYCTQIVHTVDRAIEQFELTNTTRTIETLENVKPFDINTHIIDSEQQTTHLTSLYTKPSQFDTFTWYLKDQHYLLDDKWIVQGIGSSTVSISDRSGLQVYEYQVSSPKIEHYIKHVVIFEKTNKALLVDQSLRLTLVDLALKEVLAQSQIHPDNSWIIVNPQGQYDSNKPGDLAYSAWVADDAPYQSMPIELFLNQYFEPRLLARLLNNEDFGSIPVINELNRVQPIVEIDAITPNPEHPNQLDITVTVTNQRQTLKQGRKTKVVQSGNTGVKLFRNHQQIGFLDKSQIDRISQDGSLTYTFKNIQITHQHAEQGVEFGAYAFNSDGIKSLTAKQHYQSDLAVPKQPTKAYVISIGVNEYQAPVWNLTYAAADAKVISNAIHQGLNQTKQFDKVVTIPLISTTLTNNGEPLLPTKALIKATLALLAGKPISPELKRQIPQYEQIEPLTPNDLLFFFFAGHGLSDQGEFYLFPYDIGEAQQRSVTPQILANAISSRELDDWMQSIDAGEFILVIDACNSAASVQGRGFKPGPMGSRGLGQLAYNKGMKVLTASEAESVALESSQLKHGLLTYALIREGIEQSRADHAPKNQKISVSEFLAYGQQRVPELHQSLYSGKQELDNSRGFKIKVMNKDKGEKLYIQKPNLFDFSPPENNTLISTTE